VNPQQSGDCLRWAAFIGISRNYGVALQITRQTVKLAEHSPEFRRETMLKPGSRISS
jgi:hypothetical protein